MWCCHLAQALMQRSVCLVHGDVLPVATAALFLYLHLISLALPHSTSFTACSSSCRL